MTKVCPTKLVQAVVGNQTALSMAKVGANRVTDFENLGAPLRKATITKPGEADLMLLVYPTAVPACPYILGGNLYTPVVVDGDGLILAIGQDHLREWHRQGWMISEAAWPWQSYNYGYIPKK